SRYVFLSEKCDNVPQGNYPHYFVAPISFVFSPKLQMVRQYPACVSILQKNTSPNSASSN
ncbi:hypothetical protein, partial [Porphyromonas levii]|uniref:hypothetical protein n=1 Tax=Porphyromonas levii TaxID=28114 RepID=UPI001B8BBDF7